MYSRCQCSLPSLNLTQAPVGYSEEQAGFFGAALLLTGLIAGVITSPLFDRILTHHLSLTIRLCVPPLAACWIGLIFAGEHLAGVSTFIIDPELVRPHNEVPIYVLACLIGILGFLLLPVALELGVEVTRNAETSSAILWMSGNLFTLLFVLGMFLLSGFCRSISNIDSQLRTLFAMIDRLIVCGQL